MNTDNDQTLRKIFINRRQGIALNDERLYQQRYGYLNIISKNKFFNIKFIKHSVDQTEERVFKSEKLYPETIENEPDIILYKFLGECSKYIKGLPISAKTIYMEWFGESNEHCDCCGKYRTILTSGSSKHYIYLCDKCANHYYKNDIMKDSKVFNIFPQLGN